MTKANLQKQAAITQARLHELFIYEPLTGHLVRRVSAGDQPAGAVAGYVGKSGYRKVKVDRFTCLAQRIIFFYVEGRWPDPEVDHEDRDRDNNRWVNLREATSTQNHQNRIHTLGRSGLPGAVRTSDGKRWRSSIRSNGVRLFLGNFPTAEAANAAYVAAKARLHTFQPTVRGLEG
jgi:hypothetical protein